MAHKYPDLALQLILAVSAVAALCGATFCFWGFSVFEQFLLSLPDCPPNVSRSDCCAHCFGLSDFEIRLFTAVPPWLAMLVVFIGGPLIDFLGLSLPAIGMAIMVFIGSALRLVAEHLEQTHVASVTVLVMSEVAIVSAVYTSQAIAEYIAIRFFRPKMQPLMLGISASCSYVVISITSLVAPRIALKYGVDFALWVLFAVGGVTVLSAVTILVVFRRSESMRRLEKRMREQELSRVTDHRPWASLFKTVASFPLEYWLILLACSVFFGTYSTYTFNTSVLQTNIYHISPTQATDNIAYEAIAQTLALSLLGAFLSAFPAHLTVASLGCVLALVGCLLPNVALGTPLASSLLVGLAYSAMYVSLKATIGCYVQPQHLGRACALIVGAGLLSADIQNHVLSLVMSLESQSAGAHTVSSFFITTSAVSAFFIAVLILKRRVASSYGVLRPKCFHDPTEARLTAEECTYV